MGKEISTTVPSLRLDALLGSGFGISRSKAAQLIKEGLVIFKGQVEKSPAQNVGVGEVMILANRGQCQLLEVIGESKKGRLKVVLKRLEESEAR